MSMALPRGFEPLTYPLGGDRAIQLCQGSVKKPAGRARPAGYVSIVTKPVEFANIAVRNPCPVRAQREKFDPEFFQKQ